MKIKFTKMHGLGNDFILIDCIVQSSKFKVQGLKFEDLSKRLCDRRFGIGADQMLLVYPSKVADFRMVIFNADGGEVEMCGNGIRCFAKYLWDRGLSEKKVIEVETLAGIIRPEEIDGLIKVDMGEPVFEPGKIPVHIVQGSAFNVQSSRKENSTPVIDYPLKIDNREFKITCVSMGNPHAVAVVDNVSAFPVAYYGHMIENHHLFPKRTNAEFIEILNTSEIKMRVWERGAGETLACGTGAAAAAVASHLKKLTKRNVTIHLNGGDLHIEWAANNHVYMTGPAVEVFTGEIDIKNEEGIYG